MRRIRIRLALEIEPPMSRQRRSGRPDVASRERNDRSAPCRGGHSRPARHDNRTLPVHWAMPVNAAKTCRIRWEAGRLRCRRAIVERRPAIVAEARYAHGCSSFGRTSPIVMVKPARASSSHKARLRVAPTLRRNEGAATMMKGKAGAFQAAAKFLVGPFAPVAGSALVAEGGNGMDSAVIFVTPAKFNLGGSIRHGRSFQKKRGTGGAVGRPIRVMRRARCRARPSGQG